MSVQPVHCADGGVLLPLLTNVCNQMFAASLITFITAAEGANSIPSTHRAEEVSAWQPGKNPVIEGKKLSLPLMDHSSLRNRDCNRSRSIGQWSGTVSTSTTEVQRVPCRNGAMVCTV